MMTTEMTLEQGILESLTDLRDTLRADKYIDDEYTMRVIDGSDVIELRYTRTRGIADLDGLQKTDSLEQPSPLEDVPSNATSGTSPGGCYTCVDGTSEDDE